MASEYSKTFVNGLMVLSVASAIVTTTAFAATTARDLVDKESAKNSNVTDAEKLNGDLPGAKDKAAKVGATATTAKDEKTAKDTANAVKSIPGVSVSSKDLQAPPTEPPIKGFHPIKKILRPVENLEGMAIKLEQQIMKLEGPIAALQPPMHALELKMNGVDSEINHMQTRLDRMQTEVTGVRADLKQMQKQIAQLQIPIESLQKPLINVSKPLEQVQQQLNMVLMAIIVAAIAIALGTPLAAILIYRNRSKLFPHMKENEMPTVTPGTPTSTRR